jgi:tetratricopeptide (TPR) repeat protein
MVSEDITNRLLFNEATQCLQENRNEEAIELFDDLIESEPDNVHFLNGKGSGLMQSGRIDEAEDIFNKSLAIEDNPMAYLNLAIISGHKEDYDTAIGYCDKILELFPSLKDMVQGLRNNFIEKRSEQSSHDFDELNPEAQELINKANALKEADEYWEADESYESLAPETPKFKKITIWDAWELYEDAIKKDPKCEAMATSHINDIKSSLMPEFLFFDISQNDDFNPESERDRLKLTVMKEIYIDKNYLVAQAATNQILTTIDENDLDALDYKGALSFYFDDIDGAIECFDKLSQSDDGIYRFYGDFNKAFVLRRKAMLTGDLEYMVQALDIYDEMLKDSRSFDKVKPYQREILDKLQGFMKVPLF